MKKTLLGMLALCGALAVPHAADAASRAFATANVNLRAGPATSYPAVDVVRAGEGVRVFGCLRTRAWCDVGFSGVRGWISSSYLAEDDRARRETGPIVTSRIGAPVVVFSLGDYWDDHYRGRGFYRQRDRYKGPRFGRDGGRGHGDDHWGRNRDDHWGGDRDDHWDRDRRGDGDRHWDRRSRGDWQDRRDAFERRHEAFERRREDAGRRDDDSDDPRDADGGARPLYRMR